MVRFTTQPWRLILPSPTRLVKLSLGRLESVSGSLTITPTGTMEPFTLTTILPTVAGWKFQPNTFTREPLRRLWSNDTWISILLVWDSTNRGKRGFSKKRNETRKWKTKITTTAILSRWFHGIRNGKTTLEPKKNSNTTNNLGNLKILIVLFNHQLPGNDTKWNGNYATNDSSK